MDTRLIQAPLSIAKVELQHSSPKRNFTVILSCFYSKCEVAEPGGYSVAPGCPRVSTQVATLPLRATPCSKKAGGKHPTGSEKWPAELA